MAALSDPGKQLRRWSRLCDNPEWKFRLYMAGSILTSISILLSIQIIMLRSTKSPSCTNIYFSPHASAAFNVSGLYCDQLTIKKYYDNSPALQWNTSLYLLHKMPNLSTVYEFEVSENITLSANEFYKWSFYLHEGSSYKIKACKENETELSNYADVCIIGGDQSLNKWIRTRYCEHPHTSIRMCNSANSANTFSDVIKETNFYYFVFSTHTQNHERTLLATLISPAVHCGMIPVWNLAGSLKTFHKQLLSISSTLLNPIHERFQVTNPYNGKQNV